MHPHDGLEPLSGPFDQPPSADGVRPSPAVLGLVAGQVRALLQSSPAYYQLDAAGRDEMEHNLNKIAAYSAALIQEDWALSRQLGQRPMRIERHPVAVPVAAALADSKPKEKPAEEFAPRAAGHVARITRDTLNAIAFPTFVADLIKGTYFAIVQATLQQMEAFGRLLANVAQTVDEFMAANVTENQARDYVVSSFPSHFRIEMNDEGARVKVRDNAPDSKPDFKATFGLEDDVEVDDDAAEEKLVPAARRKLAQNRHQMLAAMVLMGIQRIVVTSGRINAKMAFHIDAHDLASASTASQFDTYNEAHGEFGGGLVGALFGGPSGSITNTVAYVSSTKKDSSDAINVNADLTGEVDLKFKSDYFPMDRFAKPELMSMIMGNTPNPTANTPVNSHGGEAPKGAPATP